MRVMQFFEDGLLIDQTCCIALCAKILFQKPKVILIADLVIFVVINSVKGHLEVTIIRFEINKGKGILDCFIELFLVHQSL